jgi:methyl-accepting chemotaxis protein
MRRLTDGTSVHQKIRLLPLISAGALLLILLLTVLFGVLNESRLGDIEHGQLPALRRADSLHLAGVGEQAAVTSAFAKARAIQRAAWLLIALVTLACIAALGAVSVFITQSLTRPLAAALKAAEQLAAGDVRAQIPEHGDDEVGQLLRAMRRLVVYLREMSGVADAIAAGELTSRIEPRSADDALGVAFARMTAYLEEMGTVAREIAGGNLTVQVEPRSAHDSFGHAFTTMARTLSGVIQEIRSGAEAMSEAAAVVADSAQRLSASTNVEADAVVRTTASLDGVSAEVVAGMQRHREMEELSNQGARNAEESGRTMRDALQAMEAITDKISIVSEIARATSLLSLNASIEAARAGDAGRGFAVVAQEVRNLAQRCEAAAREIALLTTANQQIVASSGKALGALVPSIRQTSTLIAHVVESAGTQANGLAAVNAAMGDVALATRQNAASADDLAATASQMVARAQGMLQMVRFFREQPGQATRR